MLKEVLDMLGVDKLDESQQRSITEKLDLMIDVKSRERTNELLREEKEALVEEYELKFEDYKKEITSKFSDFVDSVLDEELEIPEKVYEYAKKGELYSDLIDQFKIKLAIDENVLDEEVKSLLRESKEEILSLTEQVNGFIAKKMEMDNDVKIMASELYLRKKCDGLLESQKTKVMNLLGDVTDKKEIDKKFKYVVDNILHEEVEPGTEEPAPEVVPNTVVCPSCGAIYSDEGLTVCPKCGAKMEDVVTNIDPAESDGTIDGKGQAEVVVEKVEIIDESSNPFDQMKKGWLRMLKENKL
jgi:hypothetical protein